MDCPVHWECRMQSSIQPCITGGQLRFVTDFWSESLLEFCRSDLFRHQLCHRQLIGLAQFGKQPFPSGDHQQSSYPSEDYGWACAEPLARYYGLEFSYLVGSSDEQHVDGVDAAAHLVWSCD